MGAVFVDVAVYFWAIPSAEPRLRVEFNDPWRARPGQTFELDINRERRTRIGCKGSSNPCLAPENFTISRTEQVCSLNFGVLTGGEALNDTLTLAVPSDVLPESYTVTVRVWAENVPEQAFSPEVTVELPLG